MVPDSTADPPVSPTGSSPDTIARYFDTSVLRGCSSDLVHLAGRDSSRTSALAILELIAKADESDKEFRARRAAIRAVIQTDPPPAPDAVHRASVPKIEHDGDWHTLH